MKGEGSGGSSSFTVAGKQHDISPTGTEPERGLSENGPLTHGSETEPSRFHEMEYEGGDGVSRGDGDMRLQQDQEADNPFSSHQESAHPGVEQAENAYEDATGPPASYRKAGSHVQEPVNIAHPPLRASESLSAATHTLRKATTSMKEGLKRTSVRVAHAGERMGKAWNRTLDSAMLVCVLCGTIAIILIAVAISLRAWRYQLLTYTDENGVNISRVNLGLLRLQRIQTLDRFTEAGTVKIFDPSFYYEDVITSAYCIRDDLPPESGSQEEFFPITSSARASGAPSEPEGEVAAAGTAAAPKRDAGAGSPAKPQEKAETGAPARQERRIWPGDAPVPGFMTRMLQPVADRPPQREGPLVDPPAYSLTVGRDPSAPGTLDNRYVEMRQVLLGATVFDLQCSELRKFMNSGKLFVRMTIAYFVAAGIGMLCALIAILSVTETSACCSRLQQMPINLVGTIAWVVALLLQLSAIAAWGLGTDVAACVTTEGGTAVCTIGVATALSIASLVMTLLATLGYSVFFTHTFIRNLGLEKEKVLREREESDHRRNSGPFRENNSPYVQYHYPASAGGEEHREAPRDSSAQMPRGGSTGASPRDSPMGGPREGVMGAPHPPAKGESNSPLRSITEESHGRHAGAQAAPLY